MREDARRPAGRTLVRRGRRWGCLAVARGSVPPVATLVRVAPARNNRRPTVAGPANSCNTTQPAAVRDGPAFLEAGGAPTSPAGDLMGIDGGAHLPGAVGQFGLVAGLDGGAHGASRERGQAAIERGGRGQAGAAERGGEQRLVEARQVVRPPRAAPAQRQPDQSQGQRADSPLGAAQVPLQAQGLRIGEQPRQGRDIWRNPAKSRCRLTPNVTPIATT